MACSKTDWPQVLQKVIDKYAETKHPLDYNNLYELLVMVVLSGQDSDDKINKLAPDFFHKYPTMHALSKASQEEIAEEISKVRYHNNKSKYLVEISENIKHDENIPLTMATLTELNGIGRKSANVIMREANAEPEGILVDLHVIRVANRLGIAKGKDGNKVEKQLMEIMPKKMWHEVGMSISFLGREICRPTNPEHELCPAKNYCEYCNTYEC